MSQGNRRSKDILDSYHRLFKRARALWRKDKSGTPRNKIDFWLQVPDLPQHTKRGFESLRETLQDGSTFSIEFENIRAEMQNLQCNDHVLYFLCAEYRSGTWSPALPAIAALRALKKLDKKNKLADLSKAAATLDELVPLLREIERHAESFHLLEHTEKISDYLRNLERVSREISSNAESKKILPLRGRLPEPKLPCLVAILPGYFRATTNGPQMELVSRIANLLRGSEVSPDHIKKKDAEIRRLAAEKNPLVVLDRALR